MLADGMDEGTDLGDAAGGRGAAALTGVALPRRIGPAWQTLDSEGPRGLNRVVIPEHGLDC
ncbi:hypothetical protein GCM10010464_60250 [Pseudonocardia yunnanensis]